ncbi:hypothetical protein [Streptomyces scopuliridis]|uniref:Uncharacterized protein n=1 Tax=Streptomyces scopuliridis RB72 TaxID=1440053 RepID=A0A2T7SUY8_9ACTN|nr:hypothetical protein [Streptomyces scopuliridis]PVE06641.1 hypothetical protein Y717_27970 [Streptomyces scopuliridis RB72]
MENQRRRRRGRTTLLIAAAAVLGIVAGTATGYAVQADREPTPLPLLAQPGVTYPAKSLPKGEEAEPLSAKQDTRVRTDGDLRKLLVGKPSGAEEAFPDWLSDGWMSLDMFAGDFQEPDSVFEDMLKGDFRRAAGASWTQGENRTVNIYLVQFRASYTMGAANHAEGQQSYMPDDDEFSAGNSGDPIKGSGNGRYYLYEPERKAGYLPFYRARAIAYRGDVMVDINMFDAKPISKKDIRTLAERQLERL